MAPQHPEWKGTKPFKSVLSGNHPAMSTFTQKDWMEIIAIPHDAEREFAYGPANGLPDTSVGAFGQALMDTANASGWTVISMKTDWNTIFAVDVKKAK
ncbi:hypothetical protein [Tateyamaria pelophila]|uniref:hypothetical protein n=1 Tax=Tateyamaria pelophila TaxID=328415 RepID=UPI001CBCC88A|nr:hypothetical protein [Tateyamaria pelophila]